MRKHGAFAPAVEVAVAIEVALVLVIEVGRGLTNKVFVELYQMESHLF